MLQESILQYFRPSLSYHLFMSIFEWLLKAGFTVPTRWDVTLLVRLYGHSGDISLFLLLWRPRFLLPLTSVFNKYWLYLLFELLLNVYVNQLWSLQEVLYVYILSAIVMALVVFFVCGRVPWLYQYWSDGFMVLCPGAPEGSTGSGSGFKVSQKTGPQLKVSSNRLGEDGNRTCDPWFTRHRFIPYTTASTIFFLNCSKLVVMFSAVPV